MFVLLQKTEGAMKRYFYWKIKIYACQIFLSTSFEDLDIMIRFWKLFPDRSTSTIDYFIYKLFVETKIREIHVDPWVNLYLPGDTDDTTWKLRINNIVTVYGLYKAPNHKVMILDSSHFTYLVSTVS